MRHKIVHGVNVSAKEQDAIENRETALKASAAVCAFASRHGFDLYAKLKVRRNAVEIGK